MFTQKFLNAVFNYHSDLSGDVIIEAEKWRGDGEKVEVQVPGCVLKAFVLNWINDHYGLDIGLDEEDRVMLIAQRELGRCTECACPMRASEQKNSFSGACERCAGKALEA